jgi:xanthine dehydrogenase YagR molybdenum-binding subunit
MTQLAAEALGVPVSKVIFELGDTGMPEAPVSGESQTVASVGPAVHVAAKPARENLVALAVGDSASPMHGLGLDAVVADKGWLMPRVVAAYGVGKLINKGDWRDRDPWDLLRR